MTLTYIFGRSGYGKSEYILNHALTEKKNKFILVPEQVNFEYEKKLIRHIPDTVAKQIGVLTFSSLARRVFYETGTKSLKPLGNSAKVMIIYRILKENAGSLATLKSSSPAKGLINSIMHQISEFKTSLITFDELFELSKKLHEHPLLSDKLKDLALIYREYNEYIKDKYKDAEDELMMVAKRLCDSAVFKDSVIYIDSFYSFSLLELKVIEVLLNNGNDIFLSLSLDPHQMDERFPVWDTPASTIKKFDQIAKRNSIEISKPVIIEKGRDRSNVCLNHLEGELFSYSPQIYADEVKGLYLRKLQDPFSETESAAVQIRKLVRKEGLRYRDISVIVSDISAYEPVIQEIFDLYDIPYHFDEKLDLSLHPLPKFILDIISAVSNGYRYETMADIMKSDFSPLDSKEAELLENHILEKGIRGTKWFDENQFDDEFKSSREKLMINIKELHFKLRKDKKGRDAAEALYRFIVEFGLGNKASLISSSAENIQSNRLRQSYQILIGILDELHDIFNDKDLALIDIYRIFKSSFSSYSLATIPFGIDEIFVGTISRSKKEDVKALLVLGANDGAFTTKTSSGSLFNDIELTRIHESGFDKIQNPIDISTENEYLLYTVLTKPRWILNIMAPMADMTGKALGISSIYTRISMIFSRLEVFTESASKSGYEYDIQSEYTKRSLAKVISYGIRKNDPRKSDGDIYKQLLNFLKDSDDKKLYEILHKGFSYSNRSQKIDDMTTDEMFGNSRSGASITRLQKYRMCPFSFLMQYGFGINKRKIREFTPADAGSFVHDVLEIFQKNLFADNNTAKEEGMDQILSESIDQVLKKGVSQKLIDNEFYEGIKKDLENKLQTTCRIIFENTKKSSFVPFRFELEFGEKREYPPIILKTDNGEEIHFEGKIDRVDVFSSGDEIYFAVFDYKTGSRVFRLSDVYHGLDLQLIVYLDALIKSQKGAKIAGAFYFHVKDPVIKGEPDMTDQEIEREIKKLYRLSGMAIDDIDILDVLDKADKRRGYYQMIPVGISKNGFSKYSKVASAEQFLQLFDHVEKMLVKLWEGSSGGEYDIKPVKNDMMTACNYCDYSKICQFDLSIKQNKYDHINNMNDELCWEKIKKEE